MGVRSWPYPVLSRQRMIRWLDKTDRHAKRKLKCCSLPTMTAGPSCRVCSRLEGSRDVETSRQGLSFLSNWTTGTSVDSRQPWRRGNEDTDWKSQGGSEHERPALRVSYSQGMVTPTNNSRITLQQHPIIGTDEDSIHSWTELCELPSLDCEQNAENSSSSTD